MGFDLIGALVGGLLDFGAAAAPEAAAVAAPEIAAAAAPEIAGAIALPEIAVTAPALAAGVGTEAALGGGAALGGDILGGLGLGTALGVGPALAGGLSPSSVVSGEFGALDAAGGNFGTNPLTPVGIGRVPGFGPGGTPLPQARPAGAGLASTSPLSPGGAGGPLDQTPPTNTTVAPGDPTTVSAASSGPASGFSLGGESVPSSDVTLDPGTTGSTGSTLLGGVGNFFKNNAGLLSLLGLGVGGQLVSPALSKALGLNKVPGSEQLQQLAQQEASLAQSQAQIGQTLEQPLVTGQLPPGQQQAVTNALNDAIATIKGRYASLGLSGSTMEAEAIANAQNRSTEVAAQIEQQLFQSGSGAVSQATSALGLEESIYNTILQATISQDQQLGNAISGFANAVGQGTAIGQARNVLAA